MIDYGVYNLQETKYGTMPTKKLLAQGTQYDFERMCMVHESLLAMVHCFLIYLDVYYFFQFLLFAPM